MAIQDIETRLRRIVASELGIDPDEVQAAASIPDDLGADSLDTWQMVYVVEEEFDVEISDAQAETLKTFGDLVAFVEAAVARKRGAA